METTKIGKNLLTATQNLSITTNRCSVSFSLCLCECDYQMRPLYSSLRLNTVLQVHTLRASCKSASDDNSLRINASDRMYSIISVNPSLDILFLSTAYLLRQDPAVSAILGRRHNVYYTAFIISYTVISDHILHLHVVISSYIPFL